MADIVIEEFVTNKAVGILSYKHRPEFEAPDGGFSIMLPFNGEGFAYKASITF